MQITDYIRSQLAKSQDHPVLHFDQYHIVTSLPRPPLPEGKQGTLFEMKSPIGKSYTLKVYHPDPSNEKAFRRRVDNFVREVRVLSTIRHKNIPNIIAAGTAQFDQNTQTWHIEEHLNDHVYDSPQGFIRYYIMEYYPHTLQYLFPALRPDYQPSTEVAVHPSIKGRTLDVYCNLVRDITSAISTVHRQNLAHKDIKSENILYNDADDSFVLGDFGQARHADSHKDEFALKWPHNHPDLAFEDRYLENDIYSFAKLLNALTQVTLKPLISAEEYDAIGSLLQGVLTARAASFPYTSIETFARDLECCLTKQTWVLVPELHQSLVRDFSEPWRFSVKVRIPVSGNIVLTRSIANIVDTADFQRLRGVRQLGPTAFVYPGAYHTRFEHSLGTYYLGVKYLGTLVKQKAFRELCPDVDKTIKLSVLVCLLHDVGHYPYSHWVEELDDFPNSIPIRSHEQRAGNILADGEIGTIIEDKWGISVEAVQRIIASNGTTAEELLVQSMIDSVLDVDKLDYLIRDSIHCGVDYGRSLEVPRVLDALCVDQDRKRIALTDKASSYLMTLLTARNAMYQEVYWHKTVRACTAMFKHFFYNFVVRGIASKEELQEYLALPDDAFTMMLYKRTEQSQHSELLSLIKPLVYKGRDLYKPALVLAPHQELDLARAKFHRTILGMSFRELVAASHLLASGLSSYVTGLGTEDIIIDTTPSKSGKESYDIRQLRVWSERAGEWENMPFKIGELNEFLGANRRVYVFCKSSLYERLSSLPRGTWTRVLDDFNSSKQGRCGAL